ncbi:hypothetical protein EON83_15550 [bacterium]|nr:MAG: hypothetical protein EON83_15550 [bacterium]
MLRFKSVSTHFVLVASIAVAGSLATRTAYAKPVPTPQSVLGFEPTSDRTIADWPQITNYFAQLDATSDRVKVQEIGKSTLVKPLIVAFISAPENIRNLEKYRRINQKLADPRMVNSPEELQGLLKEGKTIVSISCSIHSTEIVASQMSINLAYQLATARDAETEEMLKNTILLLIPSPNPDGVDIVANWYRKNLGTKYETTSPPELYHHYAGHDNNRDWFMLSLKETQSITRFFWQQWFPEIVYDVHQQGANGSRFILPPFFDPANPRIAPLILREAGLMGYKMASDLEAANIAGVATNSTYDTWWHGGFRGTPYFHNSIGILSEAASASLMSPLTITRERLERGTKVRGLDSPLETATNFPNAWQGGTWGPRDIARIEMISSRALLQMASKFRLRYLTNFYELGKSNLLPQSKDPQGFVVYADPAKKETTARFLEILMGQGMEIHRIEQDTEMYLGGETTGTASKVPAGSFVVFTSQPQRNNVLSLFEKQTYPNRLKPSGEAEVPYDVAGWTLPLQMNIDTASVWKLGTTPAAMVKLTDINQARQSLGLSPQTEPFAKLPNPLKTAPKIGLYKSFTGSMDEGWTRLVLDTHQIPFTSVSDSDFRAAKLDYDAVIIPSMSEKSIVDGLDADRYPAQFAGGLGEKGVDNLREYVEKGGKLICFDSSCDFAINRFKLPVKDVLKGVKSSEFYNPGSVVRLDVDTSNPLAKSFKAQTPAYFIDSAAFDISDPTKVKSVAKYADKDALLSGWMMGEKYVNGKTALAEAEYGKGKIVLFAFRPQHRSQTYGTFPFIFNALEK